jgi:hypothetical protein
MAPNLGTPIYGGDEISSLGEHFGVRSEGSGHTLGPVSAVIWHLRPPLRGRRAFPLHFTPFFRAVKGGLDNWASKDCFGHSKTIQHTLDELDPSLSPQ